MFPRKRPPTITAAPEPLRAVQASPNSPPNDAFVFAVVLAYGCSSLSGVFVNKACLSSFRFGYTVTLMLSQLCFSVVALTILRIAGIVTIPKRSLRELSFLVFPAIFFIANVTVGLLALKLVNIPMFSAFRRLSVLNVMFLEWFVLGKTASQRMLATIFVMVVGSFLAGLGDLAFDPVGYCLVFLNNFITAANLVYIKKASVLVSLNALPLFYYVSLISLPVVLIISLLSGELRLAIAEISSRPDLQTVSFAVALSLSAGSAFLINFFTNLCTQLTSPLTTAITGQMKNILQTILGIFAFGYVVTALNLFGLAIALLGSLAFARYKYEDAKTSKKLTKLSQSLDDIPQSSISVPVSSSLSISTIHSEDQSLVDDHKASLLRSSTRHNSGLTGKEQES